MTGMTAIRRTIDDASPAFDNDSLGGVGTSWMNQIGSFDGLSSEDQEEARQAHAEWQERNPEKHTFDVEATFRMPRNAMKRLLALSIKAVRPN